MRRQPRPLRFISHLIKAALWAVVAVSVGLALADVLAGRPWYSAATAAGVAILSAVLLGWPARCGHSANFFGGVEGLDAEGLSCFCRRQGNHRGLHKNRELRWDDAGTLFTAGSESAMNRVLRALGRPFGFIASQFGLGPRCGHRGQLMSGYGDLPVTCKLRRGHWGRKHRDGLAAWAGDEVGSHRAGGPS